MDAWLSTLVLAAACGAWIAHTERQRDKRRRAALDIAERVMRRSVHAGPLKRGQRAARGEPGVSQSGVSLPQECEFPA